MFPVHDAAFRTWVLATRVRWRPRQANVDVAVVALSSAVGSLVTVGESGSAWLHRPMRSWMVTAAPAVRPVLSTREVRNSATWDTSMYTL